MTMFYGLKQRDALRAEGYHSATLVEVVPNGKLSEKHCIIFKNAEELECFRDFNKDWDIQINIIR